MATSNIFSIISQILRIPNLPTWLQLTILILFFVFLVYARWLKHLERKDIQKTNRFQALAKSIAKIINSNSHSRTTPSNNVIDHDYFEICKLQKEYEDRIYDELFNEIKEISPNKNHTTNKFKHPKRSDLAKKKKRSN